VGPRAGVEGALRDYGADEAFPIEKLEEELPKLLVEAGTVYFSLGSDDRVQQIITGAIGRRRSAPNALEEVIDPAPLVAAMRLIKSREELDALQRAVDVTGAGIDAAIRATKPGMHEYQVQAVLESEYRREGSPRLGFPSIVASGPNSCTLHYVANTRQLGRSDLLLLDTGAEWDYYSADVSRTFPASGTFTPQQRAVYDIVLEAQAAGIEATRPGATFIDVHNASLRVVVQGLRRLKVLEGRVDALIKSGAYRPYFMHGTSHWLGLDVHDAGPYRSGDSSIELKAGMVLTVEPGIYIGPRASAPRELRGIGVRIEDDVLVTRTGYRNLSERIPRDPTTLEALAGANA
jgi:Xaa-Pro aminopeptidase